jgi:hypothetical protein
MLLILTTFHDRLVKHFSRETNDLGRRKHFPNLGVTGSSPVGCANKFKDLDCFFKIILPAVQSMCSHREKIRAESTAHRPVEPEAGIWPQDGVSLGGDDT